MKKIISLLILCFLIGEARGQLTISSIKSPKVDRQFSLRDHPSWSCNSQRGNFHLITVDGKVASSQQFDYLDSFDGFLAIAVVDGKRTATDSLGNILLPNTYDDMNFHLTPTRNIIKIKKDSKWGVLCLSGEEVIPCLYDEIESRRYDIVDLRKGSYHGAARIDDGKIILPCIYDEISDFSKTFGMAIKDGKKSIFTRTGRVVASFDDINIKSYTFNSKSRELCIVGINEKYGLIDTIGQIVLPIEFDYISDDAGNFRYIRREGKVGFINSLADFIIPLIYDDAHKLSNGKGALVAQGLLWNSGADDSGRYRSKAYRTYSCIDTLGNVIITSSKKIIELYNGKDLFVYANSGYKIYDCSGQLKDSISGSPLPAAYWRSYQDAQTGLLGYQDPWDRLIIVPSYEWVGNFYKGYSPVAERSFLGNPQMGIIDTLNRMVVPMKYSDVEIISENCFLLKKGGRWFISNAQGNRISKSYDTIRKFKENYLEIIQNKHHGLYDYKGKELVPSIYDSISIFNDSHIIVYKNSKVGLLNLVTNQILFPFKYEAFGVEVGKNLLTVKKDNKWGVVDYEAAIEFVPCLYDAIESVPNTTVIKAQKGTFWGVIDEKGEETIPFDYDVIKHFHNDLLIVGKDVWCY